MSTISRIELALERLRRTRAFTESFLSDLTEPEWHWTPSEFTTHVAWQVGHLAVAQYSLCLRRIRGENAADREFISEEFFDAFKLGSKPIAEPSQGPSVEEIKRVFDTVLQRSLAELSGRSDKELDVPLEQPRPAFKTMLGAIEWCPQHELVHAGQIALLRRLMGKAPLR
jgi:DinB superfamily